MFDSYEAFLALMNNQEKRAVLRGLDPSQARSNEVFEEVRQISHGFQEGLTRLFFKDSSELYSLTEFYGVF
jgi:hypothetical protein